MWAAHVLDDPVFLSRRSPLAVDDLPGVYPEAPGHHGKRREKVGTWPRDSPVPEPRTCTRRYKAGASRLFGKLMLYQLSYTRAVHAILA